VQKRDKALAVEVERLVTDIITSVSLSPTQVDSPADPVTNVDRIIDERLRAGLLEISPCGYVSEETSPAVPRDEEFTWVVDPIDGTHNLVAGLPEYGISVALVHITSGKARLAVCAMPALGLTFVACQDGGAYCNGEQLHLRTRTFEQLLLAVEFPAEAYHDIEGANLTVQRVMDAGFILRQTGSAMYDICRVATGSLYGFLEQGVKLWDVAAADLVATESGAATWSAPSAARYAVAESLDYAAAYDNAGVQNLVAFLHSDWTGPQ
jgi:myo-inositol-1(or 4)-monophosphatase